MSSFGTKASQTLSVDSGPQDIRPTILAAPVHPEAMELHRYWLACQARGGLKLGRDLPSREIAKLMSKLSVLEANADESDVHGVGISNFEGKTAGAPVRAHSPLGCLSNAICGWTGKVPVFPDR